MELRILIIEDEVLIADTLRRYLEKYGYEVVGHAISYQEAVTLYESLLPDLCLVDIRLSGDKTGIDFAQFLHARTEAPLFVFLTSQLDRRHLDAAKATFPAAYLSKPIQKETLYTTIEIAVSNYEAQSQAKETIRLYNGRQYYQVPIEDIMYLRADHNYVHIELANHKAVLQRSSLRETLEQLPEGLFVQTHRSYAVNLRKVSSWDNDYLYVEDNAIPISRGRRKEVVDMLQSG
jgi:DNA-binding LytR/AlgR family response regulator